MFSFITGFVKLISTAAKREVHFKNVCNEIIHIAPMFQKEVHGVNVWIDDYYYYQISGGRDMSGAVTFVSNKSGLPEIICSEFDMDVPYLKFLVWHEKGHCVKHKDILTNNKGLLVDKDMELQADAYAIENTSFEDWISFKDFLVFCRNGLFGRDRKLLDLRIKQLMNAINSYLLHG